jgi:hypothetical protein
MYFLIAAILSVNFFIITKKLYNYCKHNHLLSKIDLCDCTDCYQKLIDSNTEEDSEEEDSEEDNTEEDDIEEDNTEEEDTEEDNTEEDIDTLDTDETNEDTNICNVVVDNDNDNDNILQNKKDV